MNRSSRLLAPASLVISLYFPKVHFQTISHRYLNIAAKVSLSTATCSYPKQKSIMKMESLTKDTQSSTTTEEISAALQDVQLVPNKIDSTESKLSSEFDQQNKKNLSINESKYKGLRKWELVCSDGSKKHAEGIFFLRVLSYNILAQDLLETHAYLYTKHDRQDLPWETRKPRIVDEILKSNSHFVCLQEMQEEHLNDFLTQFKEIGYGYLYKKRTNDKKDGLLLLYKENIFNLLEFSKVELHQSGELLSRDNVGIVAKFSLKEYPLSKVVIATTHLLYNPRRNDVRLGQVQILLAEIERIAYIENTTTGPKYLPIILSGDFNLEPYSGVYKFIIEGSIEFVGKGRNLEVCDYRCLSNSLIPPHLYVTDECQHFNVLEHRLSGKTGGKVMLKNTELPNNVGELDSTKNRKVPFNSNTTSYQKIELADGHFVTFSSGLLTHPFQFKSGYSHQNAKGKNEATTFQNRWITVDYIFYSNITLVERYTLPTVDECIQCLPTIPNSVVGSDHLSLATTFELPKRR